MKLGEMQYWPLRVTSLVDHAEREHSKREIVSNWSDGSITRTNWGEVAGQSRRMAKALEKLGICWQCEALPLPPPRPPRPPKRNMADQSPRGARG